MSITPERSVNLAPLNTLGITATADYLVRITAPEQIPEALEFADANQLPWLVLGDGSNVVIGVDRLRCVVLKIEITGRSSKPDGDSILVTAAAGENWDELVGWTVSQGWQGIEALSLVPGTVGAAPVQNVGAYGQEVSSVITEVEVYDVAERKISRLANADCQFAYRDSIFKHEGKHRYIITGVRFGLSTAPPPPPTYASLRHELERRAIEHPTVADIREAVSAIRRAKLPDPAITPTAGSFFHNPIISAEQFEQIQANHPNLPHWPAPDGKIKLAAAWLVEQCGFKGVVKNGVGMYDKQAIALINPGHRPAAEVLAFRDSVQGAVRQRFGVELQMEPELISQPSAGPAPPPTLRSR